VLANHGVMVIGEDVADAWQKLYFFERACQAQVLAQSTGQPLIRVSDAIAEHTAAQWLKEAPKAGSQFAAVQRVVDGAGPAVHA
jgi:ribulose-5-phosphate 4-epimerase/fuculose-1-phosphate aldolase